MQGVLDAMTADDPATRPTPKEVLARLMELDALSRPKAAAVPSGGSPSNVTAKQSAPKPMELHRDTNGRNPGPPAGGSQASSAKIRPSFM